MKVVLATDGAQPSARAGTMLERMADPARTHVVVMSVNDFDMAMREGGPHHFSTEEGHTAAQRAADEAAATLRAAGFEHVEIRIEDGDGASEIVHAAEAGDIGLIVVGSGKERWLDAVVLGSVSSSVLHASPCPVLVVHRAPEGGDDAIRVVVGADGSEGSGHSIAAFAALADPARCEVTVVTASHPLALPPGGPAGEAELAMEVADNELVLANRHAEAAADLLTGAGFRVETEVVPGGAAPVLLEQAEQRGAHLVVVGARGLGRFRAKVLGSVSERVIRHAPATLVGR